MSASRLEAFLAADPLFFETPVRARPVGGRRPALPAVDLPPGWTRGLRGFWEVFEPPAARPPATGWKIHVAAWPGTAAEVAAVVTPYCLAEALPFKRLVSTALVHLMTAKYAPRASSGKFYTIYPFDQRQLVEVCRALHPQLAHLPGPRILTDLAWRDGPLSVRRGAIRSRPYVEADGTPGVLQRTAGGGWVPDSRRLGFRLPEGVALPAGFERSSAQPGARLDGYTDLSALHHSNSGGVYKAWQADPGRWVVLKEARPLSGYDRTGRSGADRLRQEAQALRRLKGVDGVPAYLGYLQIQGHEFLVEEFADGLSCQNWAGVHNPWSSRSHPTGDDVATYARQVAEVIDRVAAIVEAVHDKGVAIDDLHPGNVLIDTPDRVTLIDFEATKSVDSPTAASFHVAGFHSTGTSGRERDNHALDTLALWLLLPLTRLTDLDPALLPAHLDWVRAAYPLPPALQARLDRLAGLVEPGPPGPEVTSADLVAGLHAASTPERDDRLFPGSAEAFTFGGQGFGYGAAGVLWTLHQVGAPIASEHHRWLADRISVPTGYRGLYAGDAGVALVAATLGLDPAAVTVAAERLLAAQADPEAANIGLYAGAAGDGLGLLRLADTLDDERYLERAIEWGEVCAGQLTAARDLPRAGYLHGWTGVAQFLLELYRHSGHSRWLGYAVDALQRDLAQCAIDPAAGVCLVVPGVRRIAYLGDGSGGLALVADEILQDAEVPELDRLIPGLVQACQRTIVARPGLFVGRAGMMAVIWRLAPRLRAADDTRAYQIALTALQTHRQALRLYAVRRGDAVHMPGDGGLRVSADLIHGSAGVLLALDLVRRGGEFLPFFSHRPPLPAGAQLTEGPM